MSAEPIVIYSAASTQQAHLLKSLLAQCGIAAHVVNDSIQIAGGELPLGWTAAARVVVSAADAADARRLAEEFDRRTSCEATLDQAVFETEDGPWTDWPACPRCGERRVARCPICETSGAEFPLADMQETSAGARVLLMCRTCDDHMLPQWYRRCARCGHDYGAGIEPASDLISPLPQLELNPRVAFVLAALVLAASIITAYFLWLFLSGAQAPPMR
jgi:uncharacterized paraquat-inducible protein A